MDEETEKGTIDDNDDVGVDDDVTITGKHLSEDLITLSGTF